MYLRIYEIRTSLANLKITRISYLFCVVWTWNEKRTKLIKRDNVANASSNHPVTVNRPNRLQGSYCVRYVLLLEPTIATHCVEYTLYWYVSSKSSPSRQWPIVTEVVVTWFPLFPDWQNFLTYAELSPHFFQHFYRPQRSCGQGNIFTHCLSLILFTGGVCLSACWDATPPSGPDPPWSRPTWEQTPPGPDPSGPDPPADPPRDQTPPGKQTPAYGLWAAGTHPTGMHSCF